METFFWNSSFPAESLKIVKPFDVIFWVSGYFRSQIDSTIINCSGVGHYLSIYSKSFEQVDSLHIALL